MPITDSQEPADNDVEKLFQEMIPVIPTVVGQVFAKIGHYPDQTEIDTFVQRIGYLLWENDYRLLRSFKHESSLETWLFTIAKRHIRRWLREGGGVVSLGDLPPDFFTVQPDQEAFLLAKERDEILDAAESKLSERERKMYGLLRQGLSIKEIAEEMKIGRRSASAMKSALIKKVQKITGGE